MIVRDKLNGKLSINGKLVEELARKYETPLYVYSKEQILSNVNKLRNSIAAHFNKYRIQYPVKANSNPHVLKVLKEAGLGADCSSPGEIFLAKMAGFPMNLSTYTGNYESIADFKTAIDSGIILNLDDYHRLEDVVAIKKPDFISFRINPGIGRGGFEGIVTGGTDAKFGIPYEETRDAYQKALDLGITRFGIHMMTGSNNLEPYYFAEITQKLCMIAHESLAGLNIKFEFINIGGGLGIPYTEEETEIDLEHTFKLVSEAFHNSVAKYNFGDPELVVEPGRFLVGNSGILISRVQHVKHSYRSVVGLDAGMNTLIRPALYKAYHKILLDGNSAGQNHHYKFTGQICENSDIHPLEREYPEIKSGDLAVILDAGAYSFAMSSNYNSRPRPAEVLIDGEKDVLIRERETDQDLVSKVPGI